MPRIAFSSGNPTGKAPNSPNLQAMPQPAAPLNEDDDNMVDPPPAGEVWKNPARRAKMLSIGAQLAPIDNAYQEASEFADRVKIKATDETLAAATTMIVSGNAEEKKKGVKMLRALEEYHKKLRIGKTGNDLLAPRRAVETEAQKQARFNRIEERKRENRQELVEAALGYPSVERLVETAGARHGDFYQMKPAKGLIFGDYKAYTLKDARAPRNLKNAYKLTNGTITGGPWQLANVRTLPTGAPNGATRDYALIPAFRNQRTITRNVATYVNPTLPFSRQRILYKIGRYAQIKPPE